MKKYLLLRDNRESGPHTIEQMGSFGLHPLDLIWIENESTSWKYPAEIEEFKGLVNTELTSAESKHSPPGIHKIFVSLPFNDDEIEPQESIEECSSLVVHDDVPPLKKGYATPLEESEENYSAYNVKQPVWQPKLLRSSKAASVIAVFIGVTIGSFIIKKWVDGYVPGYEESASVVPVMDRDIAKQPDGNIQNALVTEIVPVYKSIPAKKAKKTSLKSQLKLASSNYKVGLFGGINGLQLTLFNTSSQTVDKVIVAVDYLKHNGAVVQSENVPFTSIRAKAAKTISIPPSSRGVKLRYKIVKVYSHDFKEDLREI